MRILFVLPSYALDWGGPPKVVYQVTEALKNHFQVDILTSCTDGEELVKVPQGVNLISFKRSRFHRFWRSHSPGMETFLRQHARDYDIIHIHELWLYHFFVASKAAIAHHVPFIVTPHGELDAWTLQYKGFKKKLFTALFQRRLLCQAAVIHVLTGKEAKEVKDYTGMGDGFIYEIPNALPGSANKFESESTSITLPAEPYILFLGRINIKKGCDLLIKGYAAWEHKNKYKLILAGPAEPVAYEQKLKNLVKELALEDRVIFTGSVHGSTKQLLLNNASLFALTSYAEGFPVAILEALQAGCPLLLSDKCGFDGFLQKKGVAIVCRPEVASVKNGLDEFALLQPDQIEVIRQKGRQVLKEYFSSEKITGQYIDMYNQVLKKSSIAVSE